MYSMNYINMVFILDFFIMNGDRINNKQKSGGKCYEWMLAIVHLTPLTLCRTNPAKSEREADQINDSRASEAGRKKVVVCPDEKRV